MRAEGKKSKDVLLLLSNAVTSQPLFRILFQVFNMLCSKKRRVFLFSELMIVKCLYCCKNRKNGLTRWCFLFLPFPIFFSYVWIEIYFIISGYSFETLLCIKLIDMLEYIPIFLDFFSRKKRRWKLLITITYIIRNSTCNRNSISAIKKKSEIDKKNR